MSEPWWKSAVFYQIYPRSFADSDGDGLGDLNGIRSKLEYLDWLGIDALWLSPFYPSPQADFGYDVSDYTSVDPVFGSLEIFDSLLEESQSRGIKVTIDLVANHTSDQHPWFIESKSSRSNPKRDWYWWRDGRGDGPPNNWVAAFNTIAWTHDPKTDQWYLHYFLPEQPDLNWHNPQVVEAMHDKMRFWLDRGVDGFRMDVVQCLGKDPELPDNPASLAHYRRSILNDYQGTHEIIRGLRRVLDEYPGDRVALGEVNLQTSIIPYFGAGDELHLAFNFPAFFESWSAAGWRKQIQAVIDEYVPADAWPCWTMSNHDYSRHRTRYGGSESTARAAAVMLLTLPGTPVLYQGEEIGLEDALIPDDRELDPGGRDPCRAPIPWDAAAGHGWGNETWLPFPPDPDLRNVAALRADSRSILHLYKRLIHYRKSCGALLTGACELIESPEDVVAFVRSAGGERRAVLINFDGKSVEADVPGSWNVAIDSEGAHEGTPYSGTLNGSAAVILEPSS